MQLALIAGIGVAIVSVLFALQNTTEVSVRFLAWSFDGSLALVLLLTLALGALAAGLLSSPTVIRGQWALARQARRISDLERRLGEAERQKRELETQLADLHSQSPTDLAVRPDRAAEKPYVGLRALLSSKEKPERQ
jgi:uncharacterized integral membrane protein